MSALFPAGDLPTLWLFGPLMLAIILCDLRLMRLPHPLLWITLALFVGQLLGGLELVPIIWRVLAASVTFALGLAAFSVRAIGGGDVKVLAALILLIPTQHLTLFVFLLGLGMLSGILLIRVARKQFSNENWAVFTRPNHFPVGLAIGLAGIALSILT